MCVVWKVSQSPRFLRDECDLVAFMQVLLPDGSSEQVVSLKVKPSHLCLTDTGVMFTVAGESDCLGFVSFTSANPAGEPEIHDGVPKLDVCASCGAGAASGKQLMRCSRCKLVVYCNPTCQLNHWRAGHKAACVGKPSVAPTTEKQARNEKRPAKGKEAGTKSKRNKR